MIEEINTNEIIFVADMHELVNPNQEARRIWENMQKRTSTTKDLTDLYNNCVDPLIEIVRNVKTEDFNFMPTVISLGDMVTNRIDFGEGTEKSIIGKLGKKAREQNVPQHVYVADHFHEHLHEIEDWAFRNSFWTEMRFQRLAQINDYKYIIHMNGNADAISSFVTRELLNADYKSPNEIFESTKNPGAQYRPAINRNYKDKIGVLKFISSDDMSVKEWRTKLVDNPCETCREVGTEYIEKKVPVYGETKNCKLAVLVPYTLDFGQQMDEVKELEGMEIEEHITPLLLIHESPDPSFFGKQENVEGMKVYEKILKMMPGASIIHGHTHNPELVKYSFKGSAVYQIPPNKGVSYKEILKR